MSVVQAHNTSDTNADTWLVFAYGTSFVLLHDTEREHARQCNALSQRDLDIEEILCWPKKDQKIAQDILRRVEIVDSLEVQASGSGNSPENIPVGTCWSSIHVSELIKDQCRGYLTCIGRE